MAEGFLEDSEELYRKGEFGAAYHTAKFALELDCFNTVINEYTAVYRVHYAAKLKNKAGEIDWYNVLGLDPSDPDDRICRQFVKMAKLIDPNNCCAAGAESAYQLISQAVDVLGDPESRMAFLKRWNLPLPEQPAGR